MTDTVYWIWLAQCLGPGSRHLHYILDRYASPYDVFRAESEELERLDVSGRVISALCDKNMREAYAINDHCVSHNIGILTYASKYYPAKLRNISDPPAVLYFIGELPNTNDFVSIGVVGTRKLSEYGKSSAYKIGYELASAGITVVSGMALGVDGVAACGAIKAGGKTVAVLGSGIDVVYPREHTKLYDNIIKNGAVISEYPPTTPARSHYFPCRNRIISGMSNGTLVIECDADSGAMITAKRAIEQGKDIFAMPGNVGNKNSEGTNQLIADGAQIVLKTEDVLKSYEFYYGKTFNYLALNMAKERSALDEKAIAEMHICQRGESRRARDDEGVIVKRENLLRPRKLPKNKVDAYAPSTVRKKEEISQEPVGISTEEELHALNEHEREILLAMPDDRATSVDFMMRLGYSCADVMGTLAMLEIKGLISSLPGGLYIKN